MPKRIENIIGTRFVNKKGAKCEVIEYKDSNHVTVKFDSGYTTVTKLDRLREGSVKDRFFQRFNDLNEIIDMNTCDGTGKETKMYREFHNMHIRCFDMEYKKLRPTYKDVTCCSEWNRLSVYNSWRNSQENLEYLINTGKRYELDKDILIKGNKIYSPDTCCLVPAEVNQLFNTHSRHRGELPIGITWVSNGRYVIAKWNDPIENKAKWSTTFPKTQDGIIRAFQEYKTHKEEIIKKVAEQELKKRTITKKCYEAMMRYKVEITD